VATQEGKNIYKRAPYVDLIFGPQTIHKVPSLIKEDNKIKAIDVSFPIEEKFDSLPEPEATGTHPALCLLWRAAQNIVHFVLFHIPEEMKLAESQTKFLTRWLGLVEQGVSEIVLCWAECKCV